MTERIASRVFGGLLLASVFILGTVKVEDTDAWTHLALGRDIVRHQGFPPTEQFNFPSLDMPYYNTEWLFDLVFYLAYLAGGFAGVILLKASIATLAFFILYKDSLVPRGSHSHGYLGVVTAAVVLFPFTLMAKHRFVERPDIVLMVFLSFTIYALNAYVYEGRRYLYLLPVLQVLWINMHPSVVVGVVPFGAVLVGGQVQRVLRGQFGIELPGTPSARQLKTVAAVLAAVLATSLLNPYGIDPFLLPFRVAASPWFRHEIKELQAVTFDDLYGAPFIVAALLALTFVLSIRRLSLISVLLVLPFVYLGLSARRFVFLLAIVSAPILARYLRSVTERLRARWAHRVSPPAGILTASSIVAITCLFLIRVEPFSDPRKIPGFGVNYDPVPESALRYLDAIGVTGRIFNTFHWGGYIVWRDFPRRIPIVDGRGHVSRRLLEEIKTTARFMPSRLEQLQATYGFDVAVLDYPVGTEAFKGQVPDVDFGLASPDWALVYWDDLSLVYLRRTDAFAKIIQQDEYRHVKPANGFQYLERKLANRNLFRPIEAELRRNTLETQSSIGYALLGFVYNQVGSHEKAIEMLSRIQDFPFGSNLYNAYLGLAFAYKRLGNIKRAIEYYKKAVQLQVDPTILYAIGTAFEEIGNDREAIRYLERTLDWNPRLAQAYPPLIRAYRRVGRTDRLEPLQAAYREALAHGQAEEHFRKGVKFYFEGKFHEAIAEFQASLKINPRNPTAHSNLGYLYFDIGLLDKAAAEQKRALEADAGFANAHYGLALIYRARGEDALARTHFEEYLRLEPRGYWSRQALEGLSGLSRP
ncbi:MAG: tetratricopeptide repeat protein [Candidatus Binatia bacterium]